MNSSWNSSIPGSFFAKKKDPRKEKKKKTAPPVTYLTSSSHGIEEQTRMLQEHGIHEEGNEEGRWLSSLLLLLRQTHDLSRRCRKRPPVPMTVPPRNVLFWNQGSLRHRCCLLRENPCLSRRRRKRP